MQMNALHMRFAAIAGGVVLIAGYLMCGGSWGDEQIVQIDFSIDPDWLEGAQVEIDGEVVGQLEMFGQNARSGFEVSQGTHTVRVIHPDIGCQPLELTLDKPGEKARLMLDYVDMWDADSGSSSTTLVFHR